MLEWLTVITHLAERETYMKALFLGLVAAVMFTASISSANAVVCARGVYRAGCAGPHGAAVVRKPVPHHHCYWRAGVRVCR